MANTYEFCYCKEDKLDTEMVYCSSNGNEALCPGLAWFHIECVGLTSEEAKEMNDFTCKECSSRINDTETNSSPEITEAAITDQENTDPEVYVPRKIRGHGIDTSPDGRKRMKFLIEWVGYPNERDWTWEFEDELERCYDLARNYRKLKKLGPTKLRPIGGADTSVKNERLHNSKNWLELGEVKNELKRYLNHSKYRSNLKIEVLHSSEVTGVPTRGTIMIILHMNHYYSILWLPGEKSAVIADGSNLSSDNEERKELEVILKRKLRNIEVDKKIRVDHCGAAAIMCCMELTRMYKSKRSMNGDRKISFPKFYWKRLTSTLYSDKSLASSGRVKLLGNERVLRCNSCNWSTTKGRSALLSHEKQKKCQL